MRLINQVLCPFIGRFVVVYFDDILIFSSYLSSYLSEHLDHMRQVLEVLRKEELYANLKKCSFLRDDAVFLGYDVSSQGIKVEDKKIKAIVHWTTPKPAIEVQSFHGLTTFYH